MEHKGGEDFVPFTGEKKGRVSVPKEKPIETRKEEKVTLDPGLEGALASTSDTELCDGAPVLEIHGLTITQSLIKMHPVLRACEKCGQASV